MTTYMILQHYWWFIISFLCGILVFMLFIQGGQGMLHRLGKTEFERNTIITALGHKWNITFTTLVTFGGAFFASFPRFYAVSFGGAFYVWMGILFLFIIQAVAYEFREKPNNVFGEKTYDIFLLLNGILGAFVLGAVVGTFFTGAYFEVNLAAFGNIGGNTAFSRWTTPWRGLEAITDYKNLLLGFSVLFLSRTLAAQYFLNMIINDNINKRARHAVLANAIPFVLLFVAFIITLFIGDGYAYNPANGTVYVERYKYFYNFIQMPIVSIFFVLGVVSVLTGIIVDITTHKNKGIWFSGIGTVVTVTTLLLYAGWNHTCFYPSLSNLQSSLTITNSSSGEVTLTVMSYASILVPIVLSYIWFTWRRMNKQKIKEPDYEY
ncbi:MAG: cytochrome d ubiquinol oxidase subunit II [Marinifilaceae bacterium]